MWLGEKVWPSQCIHCALSDRYKNFLSMRAHIYSQHVHGPRACDICGHVSLNSKGFVDHKRTHNKSRRECDVCGRGFRDNHKLKVTYSRNVWKGPNEPNKTSREGERAIFNKFLISSYYRNTITFIRGLLGNTSATIVAGDSDSVHHFLYTRKNCTPNIIELKSNKDLSFNL